MTKTEYILKHPNDTAAELVKRAHGEKIKIHATYVYKVRGRTKKKPGKRAAKSTGGLDDAIHAAIDRFVFDAALEKFAFSIRDLTLQDVARKLRAP